MNKTVRSLAAFSLAVTLGSQMGATPASAAETFSSEYVASAVGVRVGRTQLKTKIDDSSIVITGDFKAAGVASLFSSMEGSISVWGGRWNSQVIPGAYWIGYEEEGKAKSTHITFNAGNVAGYTNVPEPRPRESRVPHASNALNQTMDPIIAMIVPAQSMRDVCNRTVRFFDGVMRADLKLRYQSTSSYRTEGYDGQVVTCSADFKPVSGHDSKKRDITYMRDRGDVRISFAPVGTTGLYAPISATARTRIGEVRIRATRFAQDG